MTAAHRVPRIQDSETATLSSGTVTVDDARITAHTMVMLTHVSVSGTAGALFVSARTAGTSFTIKSTSGTDASVVRYALYEPYLL